MSQSYRGISVTIRGSLCTPGLGLSVVLLHSGAVMLVAEAHSRMKNTHDDPVQWEFVKRFRADWTHELLLELEGYRASCVVPGVEISRHVLFLFPLHDRHSKRPRL